MSSPIGGSPDLSAPERRKSSWNPWVYGMEQRNRVLPKDFLERRPFIDRELEVSIPLSELAGSRLYNVNLPMYWQMDILRKNVNKLVPLGYYFTFDPNAGGSYFFRAEDNDPAFYELKNVVKLRLFFGVVKGIRLKDLSIPPLFSSRFLKPNRFSKQHSLKLRGGLQLALGSEYLRPLPPFTKPKPKTQIKTKPSKKKDKVMSKDLKRVPLRMSETDRKHANKKYVFPKRKAYPIGDLYHARKAINYVQWQWRKNGPGNTYLPEAKKVMKAVERSYKQYNWKAYWTSKRNKSKNKSKLPTYAKLMKK